MSGTVGANHEVVQSSMNKLDAVVSDLDAGAQRIQGAIPLGSPPDTVANFQAELTRMLNTARSAIEKTQLQAAGLAQNTWDSFAALNEVDADIKSTLRNIESAALVIEPPTPAPTPTTSPRVDAPSVSGATEVR